MPIWRTNPVMEQPSVTLVRWRVIETERNERHFVGYDPVAHEGRVSSAIQSFDPATQRGVTRSGRVYALRDAPDNDPAADYVLGYWVQINRVTAWRDVTDTILAEPSETANSQDEAIAAEPKTAKT